MSKQIAINEAKWYQELIEDCQAIVVEHEFTAKWALIEGHHRLGKRIMVEHKNFERSKIYGEEIVQSIAKSLGRSQRTIYYAMKFAKEYPDLNALPEGKNINWYSICHKYLEKGKDTKEIHSLEEKELNMTQCPKCGFSW